MDWKPIRLKDFVKNPKGIAFSKRRLECNQEGCIREIKNFDFVPLETPLTVTIGHARRITPLRITLTQDLLKRYWVGLTGRSV